MSASDIRGTASAGQSREGPPPGLYAYRFEQQSDRSRIHLRLDPDGEGTLIVNANRIMHLNPSAALLAWLVLEKKNDRDCIRMVQSRFDVRKPQALEDLRVIRGQLDELVRPDGACPIHDLGLETSAPFSRRPSAPYRMDLALTYRCNNDCRHCYNPPGRSTPELDLGGWLAVIDRTWELGIPHLIFTGGEPTLVEFLPDLIAHAERNGQITGLNTNGRRLADEGYLQTLLQAGLDHVQITLESHLAAIHDRMTGAAGSQVETAAGLRSALASPLYVMTNTTMLADNVDTLEQTLEFLAEAGVPTVGLNALIHAGRGRTVGTGLKESSLPGLLEMAGRITGEHGQRLIWYTPTRYCRFDPVLMGLGVKGCTAALYNMCVEPDGSVLPCQSYYEPLGNLLEADWDAIWEHPLALRLRERQWLPEKCDACEVAVECGGGCPLQYDLEMTREKRP